LLTLRTSLADTVWLAFAMAASTFCPLLVLGIWWRGLTTAGAVAGLVTGGVLATTAVLATIVGGASTGWRGALLAQPAAWSMPAAFAVMVLASLLTRRSVPPSTGRVLARLHAPETLGLGTTQVPAAPR
jgi:Na+(H+)/acetate symporter ActP